MKKIYFPKTRLAELAAREGGITRDAAVEGALLSIQSMRAESDTVIEKSIADIEAIVNAPGTRSTLSETAMHAILRHADQIITLAGTFAYDPLDTATRSLCDVTDGLLRTGMHDAAPIRVHVQAIRLMAPGSVVLAAPEIEKMLAELTKILAHFNFTSLGGIQPELENDVVG